MKKLFEKKEYPQSKPEKEGFYYTDFGKAVFHRHPQTNAEWWSETLEGQGYDLDVKWFLEPVPEVKGAEEFMKEKRIHQSIVYPKQFKGEKQKEILLIDLLTEFAQLSQNPEREETCYVEVKPLIEEINKYENDTKINRPDMATAFRVVVGLIEAQQRRTLSKKEL